MHEIKIKKQTTKYKEMTSLCSVEGTACFPHLGGRLKWRLDATFLRALFFKEQIQLLVSEIIYKIACMFLHSTLTN